MVSLWEILVPKKSNEGKEFSIDYHRQWDEYVRGLSGGLTILRTAKGQWISPEAEICIEEMIPVRIYCEQSDIEQIVNFTLQHYDQKAVLAYEISDKVILKYR